MQDLDIARVTYISIVVLLNAIAAGYFFYNPIRRIRIKRVSINYFTAYFTLFSIAFVFFGFSITQPGVVFIGLNNCAFILAFYCLLWGFKERKLSGSSGTNPALRWVVGLNIALVIAINTIVFFGYFDFYLMRAAILISNCILILSFTVKYIPIDASNYTYGEKIATASVFMSISAGVIVLIILKVTNSTFFYMSSLVLAQSIIALAIMGGCLTILLSDVSDMYYRESITDMMTGLFNRRYFFRQAGLLLKSAERHFFPISLIICDIDRFKLVNDTYGHDVGDQAIRSLAQIIKDEAREIDIIARHGGEEFVALLPQTDQLGAMKLAERIRHRIETTPLRTPNGELRLTASFGIAQAEEGETIQQHIKHADIALYHAKASGRNGVKYYKKDMVID